MVHQKRELPHTIEQFITADYINEVEYKTQIKKIIIPALMNSCSFGAINSVFFSLEIIYQVVMWECVITE